MCSTEILLQMVMVSPGTHLVKTSPSPEPMSPKLKMLQGPLCNQAVNLKSSVLKYTEI